MAIRWDKLTLKAQEAVQRANDIAAEHGNPELQPVHLLLALVEDREGIVPPVLEKIGASVEAIAADVSWKANDGEHLTLIRTTIDQNLDHGIS